MACSVVKWRSDPFYGRVAVVKAGGGYIVGDFTGWIRGAFKEVVELPPGRYAVASGDGAEECLVEPPEYPWHFSVPYMGVDWGDVAEIRIYAPEPPEVSGSRVVKLLEGEPFSIYAAVVRSRRYEVRCCGKVKRYRRPPLVEMPSINAMYEVLPDRAADRTGCRDLRRQFCGGTLKDVAEIALSASEFSDALYLHPIYPAMSYHRYDVVDHLDVDERLGGWAAFAALKDALNGRGMKLVLDLVLYHVGLRNPLFPNGPFIIRDQSFTALVKSLADFMPRSALTGLLLGEPPYDTFLKVWLMPRLDYSDRRAVQYARGVVEFWAPKVDGFRLDVAHGVPPSAWEEILAPARGRYILGEHVGNPAPFYKVIKGFTAYILYGELAKSSSFSTIPDAINKYLALTPPGALPYMNTFIENHDTDRAVTTMGGLVTAGYAVIFTLPGIPSVYAGGECGVGGKASDHTNRAPYKPCPGSHIAHTLRALYKARREFGLWRGPAWAEQKRGRIIINRPGTRAEIGTNKITIIGAERLQEIHI